MSPVAHALQKRGIEPRLIFTGQHPGLDPDEFDLGNFPNDRLFIAGEANPHRHVARVARGLEPFFAASLDLVVVQGDTSSALGGAIAASRAGIPVAHVEAGLRSHDLAAPWPEEGYRVRIDRLSDLLFAPTERAAASLTGEAHAGAVHVTGNSGIDAALAVERSLPPAMLADDESMRILVTCHRRESWGDGLESIAGAVREIARIEGVTVDFVLHPNSHVAAAMRAALRGSAVRLLAPCSHRQLIERMRGAALILSDSGGIQEEAPALGVPLLVLRDKTERPEGVEWGNAVLVGTDGARIVAEVERLIADRAALARMSRRAYPYGDGRAGERIAALIEEWLDERRLNSPPTSTVPRMAEKW